MEKTRFAWLLLPLALFACGGGEYPEPVNPSLLQSSSYSSSSSSFSAPSSPSIPSRSEGRGELVVRPDLVCVPFVLRAEAADAKLGLAVLEKASATIDARFGAATSGAAKMKMLGVNVSAFSRGKLSSDNGKPRFVVTVDGAIETPLAAEADYWARGELVAALVTASHEKGPLVPLAGEGQPEIESAFGAPEIKLRDPEAHRAELVKRWVERTRTFARAAESQGAPLDLVSCEPPSAIAQNPISVEQLGLSLGLQCRIDVVRKATP